MKVLQLSVLGLSCAMALSACSSGSSNNHKRNPSTSTITPSTPSTSPSTSTTNPSGNTNANNANATETNANTNNTDKNNQPNISTNTNNTNTNSNTANFSAAMKKGMVDMKRGTFNGTLIEINNNTGTIRGNQTANLAFDQFRLGSTKVLLLQGVNDKLNSVPLRKLTAKDFPNGGFAPKDTNNAGWIGSTYGNQGDVAGVGHGLQSFGRLRFGVYTDNTNTTHMFVHGNPAEATHIFAGKTFKGSAIIGKDGNYYGLPRSVTAKIDGNLTKVDVSIQTGKTTLNFGGDIDVANKTFSGIKGGVETRGGLFGEDSIGGFFNVTDGVHKGENGVYGASSGKDVAQDYTN